MAKGYFGVDFASNDMGLLDQAMNAFGHVDFLGQYLPVYGTTAERVAYAHARGTAVLPLWNKDQQGWRCGGTYDMGHADGEEAAAAWRAIGLPAGRVIVFDFEQNFGTSGEYMQGMLDGVASAGYQGGAYLNPPNGQNHAAAWQFARQRGAHGVVFTSQNQLPNHINLALHDFVVDSQNGAYPVSGWEGDCHMWQSCIPPQSTIVPVDLDCASEHGYSLMWGSKPVAPVTTVAVETILRTTPKTNGKHAKGVEHPDGLMPVGTVLHFSPDPSPGAYHGQETTLHWVHAGVDHSLMHGWIERAKLTTVGG